MYNTCCHYFSLNPCIWTQCNETFVNKIWFVLTYICWKISLLWKQRVKTNVHLPLWNGNCLKMEERKKEIKITVFWDVTCQLVHKKEDRKLNVHIYQLCTAQTIRVSWNISFWLVIWVVNKIHGHTLCNIFNPNYLFWKQMCRKHPDHFIADVKNLNIRKIYKNKFKNSYLFDKGKLHRMQFRKWYYVKQATIIPHNYITDSFKSVPKTKQT
jgi:hypothetical protein